MSVYTVKGGMPPGIVKAELKKLGVTQTRVAKWLGVRPQTLNLWLKHLDANRLVERRHCEAILTAAHCIKAGIKEPSELILNTLEWQKGEWSSSGKWVSANGAKPAANSHQQLLEVEGLRKQIARLEQALEFYADHTSYMIDGPAVRRGAIYHRPVMDDGGTIARKALGEKGER